MKRRVLSLALVVFMLLSLMPVSVMAEGSATSGTYTDSNGISYTLNSGVLTVSGNGTCGSGWKDNFDKSAVTEVVIESGITSIGNYAFSGCSSLTSVTIPNSVTSIGRGAFYGCSSLESITIPDGMTSIGEDAFYNCSSLTSVTIPNGVTSIGDSAFYGCSSLTEINVSPENTVYSSIDGVLYNKEQIEIIRCPAGKSDSITIPDSVTSIGGHAFQGCSSLESITIPDSVTSIGDWAFSGCSSLTSVTIPNSVTSTGYCAFWGCSSLESITIPNSVTTIDDAAFRGCSSLTSVAIPDSVTSIDQQAFYGCSSLTSITIPDSVTSIGGSAFSGCSSLASITIPGSVTSIGSDAFYNTACYNNEANWEDGVLYIGNCLIKAKEDLSGDYSIKDGTRPIAGGAFSGCSSLTSITIPDSVTSIGGSAFFGCSSLTSITIPSGVTSIGYYAFLGCRSLESISIPDSVTSIGMDAFGGAAYYSDEANWENGVLYIDNCLVDAKTDLTGDCSIKDGTRLIADHAFSSCSSLTSISIPDSVTSIGDNAFSSCSSLTSISIPDSVTSIGDNAFDGCSSLTSISIPDSVTSIGDNAFDGCSSLTSISIPDSVTEIGNFAFDDCGSLTDVYYSGTCEQWSAISIGNGNDCLTNATIHCHEHSYTDVVTAPTCTEQGYTTHTCSTCGDVVVDTYVDATGHDYENGACTACGEPDPNAATGESYTDSNGITYTLYNGTLTVSGTGECGSAWKDNFDESTVTEVVIESGITSIGGNAFNGCSSLESITIPSSVKSVGEWAFAYCPLKSVTIPDSVTSIGSSAFRNCSSLTDVYYSGTCEQWNAISIGDSNDCLTNATIHLTHNYVDGACTVCGELDPDAERCTIDGITYTLVNDTLIVSGAGRCSSAWQDYLDAASVTKVVIGSGISDIGSIAFCGCAALTEIEVSTENADYVSVDGVVYSKDQSMIALYPEGKSGSFTIPDGVTTVRYDAFYDCAKLTSISIPSSVTSIQSFAFKGCTALADVYYSGTCEQWNAISIADVYNECLTDATIHLTHAGYTDVVTSPTCTERGYTTHTCTCGDTYVDTYVDALGHSYTDVVTAPTCTEQGYTTHTCTCGDTYVDTYVDAHHDYTDVVTAPTCTEQGYTTHTCSACGDTYVDTYVMAHGHDTHFVGIVDATCTEAGYTGDEVCKTCGETITKGTSIEALGHDYIDVVTAPTCTEQGYTTHTCSACGDTYVDTYVDALGHSYADVVTAPTCTAKGYTTHTCSACGDSYVDTYVDALGHNYVYGDCERCGELDPNAVRYTLDGINYTLINDILAVSGNGECRSVWKDYFDEYVVTKVVIKDGITSIGNFAFSDCSSLTSVTIPDSVTNIGIYAFSSCSALTSITIPDSVTSIGGSAFGDCSSLESITIPDGVKSIDGSAFWDCSSLTSVTIGNGVTSIGDEAFFDCSSLMEINVSPENTAYSSVDGVLYNKEQTKIILCPKGKSGSVTIPNSVTSIDGGTFSGCSSLTSVTIPNSVTSIGKEAFYACSSLESVIIGNGVTSIGDYAFYWCGALESITIPGGVTSIGGYAFGGCDALADVYYGGNADEWVALYSQADLGIREQARIHYNYVEGEHYNDPVVTAPTCTEQGYTTYTCACGYSYVDTYVNALGHSYTDVVTAPTCTEKGYTTHTCACGDVVVDTYVNALGHKTELKNEKSATCTEAGYTGDEVCKTCGETVKAGTAIAATGHDTELKNAKSATCTEAGYTGDEVCTVCGVTIKTGTAIAALGHSYTDVVTAPTCTEQGYTTHTCACGDVVVDTYVNALGHKTELKNVKSATCTEAGYTGDEVCKTCGETVKAGAEIAATGHDTELKNAKSATCTEAGYTGDEVCKTCGETVKTGTAIAATGHDTELKNAKAATCTEAGYTGDEVCKTCGETVKAGAEIAATGHKTELKNAIVATETEPGYTGDEVCTVCGTTVKTGVEIPATGAGHVHSYTDKVTAPTCTEQGYTTHSCSCGESYVDSYVDALGHKTEIKNAIVATETEPGYTGDEVCTVCGTTVKTGVEIPATGADHVHSYTDKVTAPTCTEQGYTTHSCSCGESYVDSYVDATGHDYKDGACTVCGAADPDYKEPADPTPSVTFIDVSDTAYYADPVAWAVDNNITSGYNDNTFRPMDICTRAQIVTFIWRAHDCPEPSGTASGFNDVVEGTYYYKAVLWAAEQGITGGFNDGGFHPDELVTRAQAMTFLWRANGKPAVPEGTVNTFADVPETAYYHDAVLWAVANNVTGGYDATTFGSMDGCTRAQIVTFLYRDMAE